MLIMCLAHRVYGCFYVVPITIYTSLHVRLLCICLFICRDSTSITLCVVGACCGEASIPVIIGILMHTDGAAAMPVTVLTICCLLLIVYATLHFIMTVKQAAASNSEIEMNGNTVSPFHSEKETGFALDEGSRGSNNRPGHQSIPTCDPFTSSPLHVVA